MLRDSVSGVSAAVRVLAVRVLAVRVLAIRWYVVKRVLVFYLLGPSGGWVGN